MATPPVPQSSNRVVQQYTQVPAPQSQLNHPLFLYYLNAPSTHFAAPGASPQVMTSPSGNYNYQQLSTGYRDIPNTSTNYAPYQQQNNPYINQQRPSTSRQQGHVPRNQNNELYILNRLYISQIPRSVTKEELENILIAKLPRNIVFKEIVMYPNTQQRSENRGYAFIQFNNEQDATKALDTLSKIHNSIFEDIPLKIGRAIKEKSQPSADFMERVSLCKKCIITVY